MVIAKVLIRYVVFCFVLFFQENTDLLPGIWMFSLSHLMLESVLIRVICENSKVNFISTGGLNINTLEESKGSKMLKDCILSYGPKNLF